MNLRMSDALSLSWSSSPPSIVSDPSALPTIGPSLSLTPSVSLAPTTDPSQNPSVSVAPTTEPLSNTRDRRITMREWNPLMKEWY
jgi:hypothetical protein